MTNADRVTIFGFGLMLIVAFPLGDAEARGYKVRSAPMAVTRSPTAAAVAAPAAATEASEKEQQRSTYIMRAEQALEEERRGDSDAYPELVKPTGGGATFVTGPTDRLVCIAGC